MAKAAERTNEWKRQQDWYHLDFVEASAKGDVEAMHQIWCKIAVATIKSVTDTQWRNKHRAADKKGKNGQIRIARSASEGG